MDVLFIGVNATVGSGVFRLPGDIQRAMGGWSPFAYLLCAVLLQVVARSWEGVFVGRGGKATFAPEPSPVMLVNDLVPVETSV